MPVVVPPQVRTFLSQFRRLDVYRKLSESAEDVGVARESRAGAYLSLATLGVLLYLFVGQTLDFLTPEVRTSYRVAKDQPSTLGIFFGVNFSAIPCAALSVDYANIYGSFPLTASGARNVTAREYLLATARQFSGVTADNAVHVHMSPHFNELHGKAVAGSFVHGGDWTDGDADLAWGCDGGVLASEDALVPCLRRGDVYTTLLFVAGNNEPSMQFAREYAEFVRGAVAAGGAGAGAEEEAGAAEGGGSPSSGGSGGGVAVHVTTPDPFAHADAATTLDHRQAVGRSVLTVDCTAAALQPVCQRHGVYAVPTAYTYRAGDRVSSMLVKLPVSMDVVHRHFVEDLLASPNARCMGWRQTGECNPLGPREPWHDQRCSAVVNDGASGYCECTGHTKANLVSCSHATGAGGFTCEEVCLAATVGGGPGNGHVVDERAAAARTEELRQREQALAKSVEAQERERARLVQHVVALRQRHAQLVVQGGLAKQELAALERTAEALRQELAKANGAVDQATRDEAGVEALLAMAAAQDSNRSESRPGGGDDVDGDAGKNKKKKKQEEEDDGDDDGEEEEEAVADGADGNSAARATIAQRLAAVQAEIRDGSQRQTHVHAELAAALSEAAALERDLEVYSASAKAGIGANSSSSPVQNATDDAASAVATAAAAAGAVRAEQQREEQRRAEADEQLAALRAELAGVQSELKGSLRLQARQRREEGDTVADLLMHSAREAEDREQVAHNGELLAPLDATAAISDFVGQGCFVTGVGSVDNVPGSLVFSVELPHALAFPAGLVDWSHQVSHVIFSHAEAAAPNATFHPDLRNMHDEVGLAMNPLGGGTFTSDGVAFTSFDHFLDLLETHLVVNGGDVTTRTADDDGDGGEKNVRPAYQYTVNTETVRAPLEGAARANVPPTVKILFETSPLVATVERRDQPLYRFATTTCAIIGGVFTVLKVVADIVAACGGGGGGERGGGQGGGAGAQ